MVPRSDLVSKTLAKTTMFKEKKCCVDSVLFMQDCDVSLVSAVLPAALRLMLAGFKTREIK